MSKRDAQHRFTECQESLRGASSQVGFLGVDRSPFASLNFWKYVGIIVLIGAILADIQIG